MTSETKDPLRRLARAAARRPLLHFLALGGAIFVFHGVAVDKRSAGDGGTPTVVLSARRVAALGADYERQFGSPPSPAELDRLIDEAVEEELLFCEARRRGLLYGDASVRERLVQAMAFASPEGAGTDDLHREALEAGLDRTDPVVRRIAIEKLRLLVQAEVPEEAGDADLQRFLAEHRDAFRQPARVTLRHVFFSRERRGESAASAAATAALAALNGGAADAGRLGDVFLLGRKHRRRSQRELAKVFGTDVAGAVFGLAPGVWSGPFESPYGFHLMFVEERLPERDPDLGEVRSRVARLYRQERRRERLTEFVQELRRTYTVSVQRVAEAGMGGSDGGAASANERISSASLRPTPPAH